MKKLKGFMIKIFEWSHNVRLKSKAGKCKLIASPTSQEEIQIENTLFYSVNREKNYIDGRLDLDYHVSQICKKTSKKLQTLSRVCKYMDQNIRKMLMKAFLNS